MSIWIYVVVLHITNYHPLGVHITIHINFLWLNFLHYFLFLELLHPFFFRWDEAIIPINPRVLTEVEKRRLTSEIVISIQLICGVYWYDSLNPLRQAASCQLMWFSCRTTSEILEQLRWNNLMRKPIVEQKFFNFLFFNVISRAYANDSLRYIAL